MKRMMIVIFSLMFTILTLPIDASASTPLILLDPGHGGIDGGTSRGQLIEKNLNLDISRTTGEWLKKNGLEVKMTRESDEDLSTRYPSKLQSRHKRDLQNRLTMIRKENPALFISIHVNSSTQAGDKGPLVFYAVESAPSKELATLVQAAMNQVAGSTQRPVGRKNLFLIRHAPCPAVLVEAGFVTNRVDAVRLADSAYRGRIAGAIAMAAKRYLQISP